jgi:hypothetical protein
MFLIKNLLIFRAIKNFPSIFQNLNTNRLFTNEIFLDKKGRRFKHKILSLSMIVLLNNHTKTYNHYRLFASITKSNL